MAVRLRIPTRPVFTLALLAGCIGSATAQSLLAPGAQVEKLAGGFAFVEGPVANAAGDVYFSDIPNNRIHLWRVAAGELTVARENSGGANGLALDRDGNLIACEGTARRLTRMSPDGTVTVLADAYDGKRLNSPNDLWIDPKGGIYFTDPRYGAADNLEQDGMHVYYLPPGGGPPARVTSDLERPNGVIGTPDGRTLYVADHGAGKTYAYAVESDGSLSGRREFAPQGSDGMTMDERGNVYLTGQAVTVYDPQGRLIETIPTPETPANVAFGGPDRNLLFITARTSLYAVKMTVAGAR